MEDPSFWDHQESAQEKVDVLSDLKNLLETYDDLESRLEHASVLLELGREEDDQDTIRQAEDQLRDLQDALSTFETRTLLNSPNDRKPAFFSIQAGAGGKDACDWVEILWRMYSRYFEDNGYEYEVVDMREGEEAGIRQVVVHVKEEFAFGYLKSEMGVHRLVRISPFDSSGRRHTSFCAVDVVPEQDEIDIDINENDLEIDTYRASGAGGQHVNVTDSAVRITYLPKDLTVQCQNERSQHQNRRMAMKMLRSRLHALKKKEQEEELKEMFGEKGEIAWGNQIRSYFFDPQERIKDHRTGKETHHIEPVLDGEIGPFIEAYLRMDLDEQN